MKITSRLALEQLSRNKKRTAGTLLAIALSSALMTAVICFAQSVINMLKNDLGGDLGEYGGAYRAMVFLPALILTLLIAFMSVTVVSNIFQASANDRIKELGVLRCVGGTSKQIKKTVISEGLWLSLVGIPSGLILGTLLGYAGVSVAGAYIGRLTEITRSIVMRKFDLKLEFSVNAAGYLPAAAVSFITVLFSAMKPAKQMSRITAVECVSFGNTRREKTGKVSGSRLWKALWGFEGELAARNISRNKRSFRPAVRALSTGICLLLTVSGLAAQLDDIKTFMTSEHNRMLVDYTSLRDEGEDAATGRRSDVILNPINADTYNEITEKLSDFGDLEVWGIGSNRETYYAKADSGYFTDEGRAADGMINEYGDMDFEMVALSEELYRDMCEASGTEYGGNILINTYVYNRSGERREITPFTEDLDKLTLITPDGRESEMQIDGFLGREDTDEWYFGFPNRGTVMVIVHGASARSFDWYCEPGEREEEFAEYARCVMNEYYPVLSEDSYAEQGYTVRISREDTMVRALNVMIILGEVILCGFVILLTLIGSAGFISTVTANIRARSREFAVLKSVGMTSRSLKKMLYSESMYCTAKASVKGVFFGMAIPWLISLSLRSAFPVKAHPPIAAALLSILAAFAAVLIITHAEIRRMKGHSLIETIRMESIR
ncbi:MAG: ABC transporter permease [Ruminococcus sp.]|nr:ABC transporter permease [Ruminococcus sp.]